VNVTKSAVAIMGFIIEDKLNIRWLRVSGRFDISSRWRWTGAAHNFSCPNIWQEYSWYASCWFVLLL